jgi:hypothetical protein
MATRKSRSAGAAKPPSRPKAADAPEGKSLPQSPRELVITTRPAAGLRAELEGLGSATGTDVSSLERLLSENDARLQPIFGSEARIEAGLGAMGAAINAAPALATLPSLSTFYNVIAPPENLDRLQSELLDNELVTSAYIQPPLSPPVMLDEIAPPAGEAPPATADLLANQLYLEAAPGGIGARAAWRTPGARGQGVNIIDIEGAWRWTHEDLLQNQGGNIGGTQSGDIRWRNHGTNVVGVFGGDQNSFGVTGIAPLANTRTISIFGSGQSSSKAITDAANALNPGDIILIELHAPGPRHNFQDRQDQLGYIAIEWWPANFAAIVYATTVRGVIVIEAGGNGAENFDDPLYNTPAAGFGSGWRNPFNLGNPQSGAVIVGAGAPPPGTHGRNHGADRSRLGFSNFGSRVDVQGWGREVTTTGGLSDQPGDLQGGANEDLWYTDRFSGTSSASPVVVGAVAVMQGALRAASKTLLTPATARNILRTTGSLQQDGPNGPASQRIGNRPDLDQAFTQLGVGGKIVKEIIKEKEFKEKDLKDIKDVTKEKEKDLKDKEILKDIKDRVKEGKEKEKELKEKDKDIKDVVDSRKSREKLLDIGPSAPTQAGGGSDLEARLVQLEAAVVELAHFITQEQRPDVQGATLAADAAGQQQAQDLQMLSQELQKQASDAKAAKDGKDIEKVREV